MTSPLFDYPQSAAFKRVLPKVKIYEHAKPSSAVKQLFVRQVDQIIWQYKLSPETINLKPSKTVPEIQIIQLDLKTGELKDEVLYCIDLAVSFPIIFELFYEGKIRVAAAFKRPSDAEKGRWVLGHYFKSNWLSDKIQRAPLPVALNLKVLYQKLLTSIMPYPAHNGEELKFYMARMEQIQSKQREIIMCEAQLKKEKQFNNKIPINAELRRLKNELDELTRTN